MAAADEQKSKRRKKREATETEKPPSQNGKRRDREPMRSRVRNAPLAVDLESGIWCCAPCPSPLAVTKNLRDLKKQNPKPPNPQLQKSSSRDSNPRPPNEFADKSNSLPLPLPLPLSGKNNSAGSSPLRLNLQSVIEQKQREKFVYRFNDPETSDVRVCLRGKNGFCANLNLHIQLLAKSSKLLAAKLAEQNALPCQLEIVECADVEVYVETLRLMYCTDVKRRLVRESVNKVLRILQVSATIGFDAGVFACLEYLEAAPWTEEEEEKVVSFLMQPQLDSTGAGKVLRRILTENSSGSEEVLIHVLQLVTKANNEKARREMKPLVLKMMRENAAYSNNTFDVSDVSLYHACRNCLDLLLHHFKQVQSSDFLARSNEDRGSVVSQIARQADNMHWLLDILTDRHIADDFVCIWASQSELAALHSKIPIMFRYEVSRLTARLCIAIGKGQVLAPKDIRMSLLQTWLQPLIDDYGWLQRACKSLDMKVVEDGICQTILTLPLKCQQTILLTWLNQFLSNADDCPNLQRAFEVWWRRTFIRPYIEDE